MHEQHTCGGAARSENRSAAEDLRDLIGLSARLARQGCGEAVIELALSRKGAQPDTAHLIAASVVRCQDMLAAAGAAAQGASAGPAPPSAEAAQRPAGLRPARAMERLLSKMLSLLICVIVGAGGGALLGWGAGFDAGVEDGARWMVTALVQLALR